MENLFELILGKLNIIEESLKGLSSHIASREKQGETHPEYLNITQKEQTKYYWGNRRRSIQLYH
jgi:hypothetical protein